MHGLRVEATLTARSRAPFGSVILPALLALTGGPAFGWAKPVPVNPSRLRRPRGHMLSVGLAGPVTNFLLMTAAALAGRTMLRDWRSAHPFGLYYLTDLPLAIQLLVSFALVNLILGVFNLLPIPPLDGSSLIERVLPASWLPRWHQIRPSECSCCSSPCSRPTCSGR